MQILSLIIIEKVNSSLTTSSSSSSIRFDGRVNVVHDVITTIDNINKKFGGKNEIITNDQHYYYDIIGDLRYGGWNLITSNSYFDTSSLSIYKSFYFESNKTISNNVNVLQQQQQPQQQQPPPPPPQQQQQQQQQTTTPNSVSPRRSIQSESLQSQLASITPTERDSLRSSLRDSLSSRLSISGVEKRPSLSILLDNSNEKQQQQQQPQQQQQQQRSSLLSPPPPPHQQQQQPQQRASLLPPPPPPPPPAPAISPNTVKIPPPVTRNSLKSSGSGNNGSQSPMSSVPDINQQEQSNVFTPITDNRRNQSLNLTVNMQNEGTPIDSPYAVHPFVPPPAVSSPNVPPPNVPPPNVPPPNVPPPSVSSPSAQPDSASSIQSIFGKSASITNSSSTSPMARTSGTAKTNVSSELDYKNSELFKRLREEQELKKKNENPEEAAEAKIHDASKTAHFTRLGAAFSQRSSTLFSPRGGRSGSSIGGRGSIGGRS